MGKQGAGPRETALNFVEQEQRIVRSAAVRDGREKAGFRENDAPLSLNGLHQHRAGLSIAPYAPSSHPFACSSPDARWLFWDKQGVIDTLLEHWNNRREARFITAQVPLD